MKKLLVLSILASTLLFGADEDTKKFTTHTELGYLNTFGNTNVETFSLGFKAEKDWNIHSVKFALEAIYGTENDVENNNKIVSEINYNYQFSEHTSVNFVGGYKKDPFSGYTMQAYVGPGMKYIAVENKSVKLDFQGNILYAYDDKMTKYYSATLADGTPDPDAEIKYPYFDPNLDASVSKVVNPPEDYSSWMLKANFKWQINENLTALEHLSVRSEFKQIENYFLTSKTAIEAKIDDIFSMGASYKLDYAGLPPLGNVNADNTFLVSLIVDYDLSKKIDF